MKHGFTTGSCAAAAAKAAIYMLLFGTEKKRIRIMTPKGVGYEPEIVHIKRETNYVSCAVIKDGGDDPDVTSGALVFAEASVLEVCEEGTEASVIIDGGEGVGRVMRPGLDQPVGNAAINSVPRKMIATEVRAVCAAADFHGTVSIKISVPNGEKLAERTFNPRLGIKGGISIIGTSGIVEPMSRQAIVDTIRVELRQKKMCGDICAYVSPGNYGAAFMIERYGYDIDKSVKCSNFIGETVDMAAELGFKNMLLSGNIGKLVKVAGGIMNTHSHEGDCRMELLVCAALKAGMSADKAVKILDCAVTDEALQIIKDDGRLEAAMENVMERVMYYLNRRAAGRLKIECLIYSTRFGELAKSKGADKWLILSEQDRERQI